MACFHSYGLVDPYGKLLGEAERCCYFKDGGEEAQGDGESCMITELVSGEDLFLALALQSGVYPHPTLPRHM